jgi:hypothetical protein
MSMLDAYGMEAAADRRLAEWFREDFACRFGPRCLPGFNEPTLGHHLVVCIENPDGTLTRWDER